MSKPLKPSPALLSKLGSIIVHMLESHSPAGHAFDEVALTALLKDDDVLEWMRQMNELALLPLKR